jgi:hypothetical protein
MKDCHTRARAAAAGRAVAVARGSNARPFLSVVLLPSSDRL